MQKSVCSLCNRFFSEQQGYAPYARKSYNSVYYTADYGGCSAESPSYQVKLKKSDKSPVQSTDYYKDKADFIKHNITPSAIIVFTAEKVLFTKKFLFEIKNEITILKNLFQTYVAVMNDKIYNNVYWIIALANAII